ncbi:MAG: biotin transporter BioY, partial [Acidimicrobiia bacterium]
MQSVAAPRVITGRIVASNRVAAIVAVVAFAGLTALAAQIRIPLGFTPVPVTGQTFAVLLAGAALGARLGASSQLL